MYGAKRGEEECRCDANTHDADLTGTQRWDEKEQDAHPEPCDADLTCDEDRRHSWRKGISGEPRHENGLRSSWMVLVRFTKQISSRDVCIQKCGEKIFVEIPVAFSAGGVAEGWSVGEE